MVSKEQEQELENEMSKKVGNKKPEKQRRKTTLN
jgi:hypothetical protein